MKPADFGYLAPRTREEAVELLSGYGERAKLLAGGQTLVPMMNFRLVRPEFLIDINRIDELDYIKKSDDVIAIGALTRHRTIEKSEIVKKLCPLASRAAPNIAHAVIRNRGTVGGSLAHSDPAAEWALVVTALGGELVIEGARGVRKVPAHEFFVAQLTTALAPDELLVEIRLPAAPERTGSAFIEVNRRHGDFALASVAAQVTVHEHGTIKQLVIALGAVTPVPLNLSRHGRYFEGCCPEELPLEEISRKIAGEVEAMSDIHASSDLRRDLVQVLVPRAVRAALAHVRDQT